MAKQIYEIMWEARCLEFAFGVSHWIERIYSLQLEDSKLRKESGLFC